MGSAVAVFLTLSVSALLRIWVLLFNALEPVFDLNGAHVSAFVRAGRRRGVRALLAVHQTFQVIRFAGRNCTEGTPKRRLSAQ